MRWYGLVFAAVVLVPATVQAQFFDNFDSYAAGSTIAGQGGWETWAGDPGADAVVVNNVSYSWPNSLAVSGEAHIVHEFSIGAGEWDSIARVFVPSTQTGDLYYNLLNFYNNADPANSNWSCQLRFSAVDGVVESLGGSGNPSGAVLPIITDEWVEIYVYIELEDNVYTVFYNGVLLDQLQWNVTGVNEIGAVELFSDGSSAGFYDNIYLDTWIPVELQSFAVD
jgi:hypothetical protein